MGKVDIEGYLGSPIFIDMSENALKIRRNLLAVSIISLFIFWADIKLASSQTFIGLTFNNLSDSKIKVTLLVINFYLLIHFIWYAWDGFHEWRLRHTGLATERQGGAFSEEMGERVSDVRQSTLYNWWLTQYVKNGKKLYLTEQELLQRMDLFIKNFDDKAEVLWPSGLAEARSQFDEIRQTNENILFYLKHMKSITDSGRIETSLARFDNWYFEFYKSQNARFIYIEIALPIILGILAVTIFCGYYLPEFLPSEFIDNFMMDLKALDYVI